MTTAPQWDAAGLRLLKLRSQGRRERKKLGATRPETLAAIHTALAETFAALAIDDAKRKSTRGTK